MGFPDATHDWKFDPHDGQLILYSLITSVQFVAGHLNSIMSAGGSGALSLKIERARYSYLCLSSSERFGSASSIYCLPSSFMMDREHSLKWPAKYAQMAITEYTLFGSSSSSYS
jgi:hypothetical protein